MPARVLVGCESAVKGASSKLYQHADSNLVAMLVVGSCCAAIGLGISLQNIYRHVSVVRRTSLFGTGNPRAGMMIRVLYSAPVYCCCSVITLFAPEMGEFMDFVMAVASSCAFGFFMVFVLMSAGGHLNLVRPDNTGTLQQVKPTKIWAKPPLCLAWVWCYPFMTERALSMRDLRYLLRGIWQYTLLSPITAFLNAAINTNVANDDQLEVRIWCSLLNVVSTLVGIYCALVLLGVASRAVVHDKTLDEAHHLKAKFKFVQLGTVLPKIIGLVVGLTPLANPYKLDGGEELVGDAMAAMWSALIVCIATIPLALLGRKAFRKSEHAESAEETKAELYKRCEVIPVDSLTEVIDHIVQIRDKRARELSVVEL